MAFARGGGKTVANQSGLADNPVAEAARFESNEPALMICMHSAKRLPQLITTLILPLACLALHDKAEPDPKFLALLPLIEQGAHDGRNFVKKAVSWALRSIGRRNLALNTAALPVAGRLALSEEAACRWVGKDALRELSGPKVQALLARRARRL